MNIKKISAVLLCMLMLSACGTTGNTATPDSAAETSSALTETVSKNDIPEIKENFSGNETAARIRGSAAVQLVDDAAASDGRAMFISGRQESWNGAEYPQSFSEETRSKCQVHSEAQIPQSEFRFNTQ